jgi:hypothetical protein
MKSSQLGAAIVRSTPIVRLIAIDHDINPSSSSVIICAFQSQLFGSTVLVSTSPGSRSSGEQRQSHCHLLFCFAPRRRSRVGEYPSVVIVYY